MHGRAHARSRISVEPVAVCEAASAAELRSHDPLPRLGSARPSRPVCGSSTCFGFSKRSSSGCQRLVDGGGSGGGGRETELGGGRTEGAVVASLCVDWSGAPPAAPGLL